MRLAAEVALSHVSKHHEELCGDAAQVVRTPSETTIILSDGLGSGVKANIMATLTTQIASGLLKRKVSIEHVISTIADTLPTCKVRGLAYSTLSILQILDDGSASLFEYDAPPALLFRGDKLTPIERQQRQICGRQVTEARFYLQEGDVMLMVTDGVIHAGVGASFDLGLGEDGLLHFLGAPCSTWETAELLADFIIDLAKACYKSEPGDDCSAVAIRIRQPQTVRVMTGPPLDPQYDTEMVKALLSTPGAKRVVCGGTTAQIVSRILGEEIETSLEYIDPRVPPTAVLPRIDLTTEGVLTLNRCYELLRSATEGEDLPRSQDGATLLARILWNAEEIVFLVGRSFNQAHANLEELMQLAPRQHIIAKLARLLEKRGIRTEIAYY